MTLVNFDEFDEPDDQELPESADNNGLVNYIDAAQRGDQVAVQKCIDDAIASKDMIWIRSLLTVNQTAMLQLTYVNKSLRIAQQEVRGWRNIAQSYGEGIKTKLGRSKFQRGDRQLGEVTIAKEEMGDDYLITVWSTGTKSKS